MGLNMNKVDMPPLPGIEFPEQGKPYQQGPSGVAPSFDWLVVILWFSTLAMNGSSHISLWDSQILGGKLLRNSQEYDKEQV